MANVIKITCRSCGKELNIPAPQQPGIYTVTCPFCQGQMKVKYNPKPITFATPMQPTPTANPMPTPMQSPMPNPMPANNAAQHNPTRRFNMQGGMPGAMPFSAPTPQPQPAANGVARLSMVRLGCDKEYFPLHVGENIIGRRDDSQPSDVAIDGDMTMSRRSVKIVVSFVNGGCQYQLTVLKAANPVQVNGTAVAMGQTVPLTMGASIYLGQTMLRLEK